MLKLYLEAPPYDVYKARIDIALHGSQRWENHEAPGWSNTVFFPAVKEDHHGPMGISGQAVFIAITYSMSPSNNPHTGEPIQYQEFSQSMLTFNHNFKECGVEDKDINLGFTNTFFMGERKQPNSGCYLTMIPPSSIDRVAGHSWFLAMFAVVKGLPPFNYTGQGFYHKGELASPGALLTKSHAVALNKAFLFIGEGTPTDSSSGPIVHTHFKWSGAHKTPVDAMERMSAEHHFLPAMKRTFSVANVPELIDTINTLINSMEFKVKYEHTGKPPIGVPPPLLPNEPYDLRKSAWEAAYTMNLTLEQFEAYMNKVNNLSFLAQEGHTPYTTFFAAITIPLTTEITWEKLSNLLGKHEPVWLDHAAKWLDGAQWTPHQAASLIKTGLRHFF